jgi:hypothetical protein
VHKVASYRELVAAKKGVAGYGRSLQGGYKGVQCSSLC